MIEGKRILITGATGFIGKYISRKLSEKNKLYVVGRKKPEIECEWIETDLSKELDIEKLPREIDYIIHLAAVLDTQGQKPKEVFNVNVGSTLSLLEYGKEIGIKKFIYTSTSICGYREEPTTEETEISIEKLNYYYYTKAVSEQIIKKYSENYTTIIIRPHFVYGKGQEEKRLLPRLIQNIKEGNAITVFNEGRNPKISLIYIKEFVEAFVKVMQLEKSVTINMTSNERLTIKEIGEIIGKKLGREVKFEYKEDVNKKNITGNITKLIKLTGFEPQIKLEEGIKDQLDPVT